MFWLILALIAQAEDPTETLSTDRIYEVTDSVKEDIIYERHILTDLYAEIEQLRLAVEIPPPISSADSLYLRGALGWAKVTYQNIIDHPMSPDSIKQRAFYMYCVISYQQSNYKESVDKSHEFLRIYPGSAFSDNIYMILSLCHFSMADFIKSREYCSRISSSSPQFPFALYISAISYFQENKNTEGIGMAKEKLNEMAFGIYSGYLNDEWKSRALMSLAQLHYELGELQTSYEYYELAKDKGADRNAADFGIAWIYIKVGLLDEALEIIENLERRDDIEKIYTDVQLAKAAILIQKESFEKTFDIYSGILKRYSVNYSYENVIDAALENALSSSVVEDVSATRNLMASLDNLIAVSRLRGRNDVADSLEKIKSNLRYQQEVLSSIGFQIKQSDRADLEVLKQNITLMIQEERARTDLLLMDINYLEKKLPAQYLGALDSIKFKLTGISLMLADIENQIGARGITEATNWLIQAQYGAGVTFFMMYKDVESQISEIKSRIQRIRYEMEEIQEPER
ncbi:hypothetical protein JW890_07695 [candidate division WOR-3 bacterium]|nr:hypothetical protein [candidate division WOR-3 bacterium]